MRRACEICGESKHKKLVLAQRFEVPTRGGAYSGYDVVVCQHCGFGFADSIPDQAFFDKYYGALSERSEMAAGDTADGLSDATRDRNIQSLENLLPFIQTADKILEIGCFTGYFLSLIQERVPSVSVAGIEPSEYAAAIARDRYGLAVHTSSVFDDHLDIGRFDVLIALHVFEHIVDLNAIIKRLRRFMNSGARICIEVPNAADFIQLVTGPNSLRSEPYLEFNFEHINYFTPRSLQNFMTQNGFETVSVSSGTTRLGNADYPVINGTFSLRGIDYAKDTLPSLESYSDACRELTKKGLARIRSASDAAGGLIVWGAGPHTQRLIGSGGLKAEDVRFFVDSSPALIGGLLAGRPILAPEAAKDFPELPILVSSYRWETEIAERINRAGYRNDVVMMYERDRVTTG